MKKALSQIVAQERNMHLCLLIEKMEQNKHNKSSELTRGSFAALRGECLGRAARLKRYTFQEELA